MSTTHARELELRRLRAGELSAGDREALRVHLGGCADCARQLERLEDEDRAFQKQVPFARFEAGVLRKAFGGPAPRVASGRSRWFQVPAISWGAPIALAAALLVVVVVRTDVGGDPVGRGNRLKGTGAGITLHVAAPDDGPQRIATEGSAEALAPGERIRIGYRAGTHRYLLALSIDATGEITPLYPEQGESLAASGEGFLPDSLEFTGSGPERVVVVMSEVPVAVDEAIEAARRAFVAADTDVEALSDLELGVATEQFHQTVLKP